MQHFVLKILNLFLDRMPQRQAISNIIANKFTVQKPLPAFAEEGVSYS